MRKWRNSAANTASLDPGVEANLAGREFALSLLYQAGRRLITGWRCCVGLGSVAQVRIGGGFAAWYQCIQLGRPLGTRGARHRTALRASAR